MDAAHYFYAWITAFFEGICILIILIIIIPNIRFLHKLPPSSFLIFWLCIADSLNMVNGSILAVTHLAMGSLEYDAHRCQIQGAIITFGGLLSLSLCGGLALFRYLIIVRETYVTHRFATAFLCCASLVAGVTVVLPFLLHSEGITYIMDPVGINCSVAWFNHDGHVLASVSLCALILSIPLTGISFMYFSIYRKVSKTNAELKGSCASEYRLNSNRPSNPNHFSQSSAPDAKSRIRTEGDLYQMRLLVQSIILVGNFLLGWMPYLAFALAEVFMGTTVAPEFEYVADFCIILSGIVNGVAVLCYDDVLRSHVWEPFKS